MTRLRSSPIFTLVGRGRPVALALLACLVVTAISSSAHAATDLHLLDTRLAVAGRLPPEAFGGPGRAPGGWTPMMSAGAFFAAELGLAVSAAIAVLPALFSIDSTLSPREETALQAMLAVGLAGAIFLPGLGVTLVARANGFGSTYLAATLGNILGFGAAIALSALTEEPTIGVPAFLVLPALFATLGGYLASTPMTAPGFDEVGPEAPTPWDPDQEAPDGEDDDYTMRRQAPPNPFRVRPPPVATVPVLALRF